MAYPAGEFYRSIHSYGSQEAVEDDGTPIGPVSVTHPLDTAIRSVITRNRNSETILQSVDPQRRACNLSMEAARQHIATVLAATELTS